MVDEIEMVSEFEISYDGIPNISNTASPIESRRIFAKNVKSRNNVMNSKSGKFPKPQAESTSINSDSSTSTLPPPEDMSSIQDVTEPPYVSKWATLSSISEMFNSKDIVEDIFEFGKNLNADLVSSKGADIMTSVSNRHFLIERHGKDGKAYIHDNSKYGTYLNNKLIGKGNKKKLDHADKISIFKLQAFVFLKLERSEQPNDLTKEFLQKSAVAFKATEENQELKKSKPTVKGSKSSKIPKPNGLNISYQNDDDIPDISDIRPMRNQSSFTKSKPSKVKKSRKITEISPESKSIRKTRSSLKNRSKSEKDVDPENIILTKRLRK